MLKQEVVFLYRTEIHCEDIKKVLSEAVEGLLKEEELELKSEYVSKDKDRTFSYRLSDKEKHGVNYTFEVTVDTDKNVCQICAVKNTHVYQGFSETLTDTKKVMYITSELQTPIMNRDIFEEDDFEYREKVDKQVNGTLDPESPLIYAVEKDHKSPIDYSGMMDALYNMAIVIVVSDGKESGVEAGKTAIIFPDGTRYMADPSRFRDMQQFNKAMKYMILEWYGKIYDWNLSFKNIQKAQTDIESKDHFDIHSEMAEKISVLKDELKCKEDRIISLEQEIKSLKSKLDNMDKLPIIYHGNEKDYFNDEIKDFVLMALMKEFNQSQPATRKADVLIDIINNNGYEMLHEQRKEDIKSALKGYKNISSQTMKQDLEALGFTITAAGKHYKVTYYGDDRYQTAISATPSDSRAGANMASIINNMCN